MVLGKKVTVSALTISLLLGGISTIPLSNKTFVELANIEIAYGAGNFDYLTYRLNEVRNVLSENDKEALNKLRTELNKNITKEVFEKELYFLLDGVDLNETQVETLYAMFKDISNVYYISDYSNISEIINNESYKKVLRDISASIGITDLKVDDLFLFIFGDASYPGIEGVFKKKIIDIKMSELIDLYNNKEARNRLIYETLDEVSKLNLPGKEDNIHRILSKLGVTTLELQESAAHLESLLDSNVVKNASLVLLKAYITLENNGEGNPEPNPSPGTGGGSIGNVGGGGTAPSITNPIGSVHELSNYDVSSLVEVLNGKAKLILSEEYTISYIRALKEQADKEGNSSKFTLTLELGPVQANTIEVPISAAIIQKAKEAKINNIVVTFNGLSINLPLEQFNDDIKLTTTKLESIVASSVTDLPLASDVYEFGLMEGSKNVTSFEIPLEIKIPITNKTLDNELLSLAKIVDNGLQIHGGIVRDSKIIELRNTFSPYVVVENTVSFSDVSRVKDWAGRQIEVVAAKGAIEGKTPGIFAPFEEVTRAEFSKMLIKALDLETNSTVTNFQDVKSTDWFASYVSSAAEKGIITGRTSSEFFPNELITRAEMATMVTRALKTKNELLEVINENTALQQFKDASEIGSSLRAGVAFAAESKLIIGDNGNFKPNNNATRAEAAVIIYRSMNN